jgi:cytochrome c oxidase subunit 2
MNIIIAFCAVLVLVVLGLLVKTQNLVDLLTGSAKKRVGFSNKINAAIFPILFVVGFASIIWLSFASKENFLPEASSEHGLRTDFLFWVNIAVISIVFFVTHALLFYFPYKYQYSEKRKALYYPENHKLEAIWTAVPAVVLATLIFSGWKVWSDVMKESPKDAVVVEIVGKQFNWIVRYPGKDLQLGSHNFRKIDALNEVGIDFADKNSFDDFISNEVHIPKGQPVLFKIRARDVLHSVFAPHFRVKMDAVPGMPTQFWFVPTKTTDEMRAELNNPDFNYEIACTEVCGRGHFGMRKLIIVHEPDDYKEWMLNQESFLARNPDYIKNVPDGLKKLALQQIKSANDLTRDVQTSESDVLLASF